MKMRKFTKRSLLLRCGGLQTANSVRCILGGQLVHSWAFFWVFPGQFLSPSRISASPVVVSTSLGFGSCHGTWRSALPRWYGWVVVLLHCSCHTLGAIFPSRRCSAFAVSMRDPIELQTRASLTIAGQWSHGRGSPAFVMNPERVPVFYCTGAFFPIPADPACLEAQSLSVADSSRVNTF